MGLDIARLSLKHILTSPSIGDSIRVDSYMEIIVLRVAALVEWRSWAGRDSARLIHSPLQCVPSFILNRDHSFQIMKPLIHHVLISLDVREPHHNGAEAGDEAIGHPGRRCCSRIADHVARRRRHIQPIQHLNPPHLLLRNTGLPAYTAIHTSRLWQPKSLN